MGSSDLFDLFADPPAVSDTGAAAAAADAASPTQSSVDVCPRCHRPLDESVDRFYGPCAECRAELKAKFLGEGREVEVAEYVPKMNVTPNAVALKDD
ncbi:MAG: hypothetical protein ACO3C1_05095 [Ilumatobacteraceae bacterium]